MTRKLNVVLVTRGDGTMTLTVGSLFAGIGGIDLGLERAGMTIRWQVEIDPNAQAVLRKHWPDVPKFGDVRDLRGDDLEAVDLVCGGFPCQDVSVAGRRAGLDGERSGLWWEFHRVLAELRPRWVLVENVPGLLSSNGWRDMGAVLGSMGELGYGYAYRVLDAQWFGVAQRRRRVFIVGHLGDPWSAPAEVLFEPESGAGDPPPSREKGQVVASPLASGAGTNRPAGIASERDFLVTQALTGTYANGGADDNKAQAGFLVAHSLTASRSGMRFNPTAEDFVVMSVGKSIVRRLTPRECERLQGFPDGWTRFGDGREISDSTRYRLIGNAVAVPVAEWIGRRILAIRGRGA